MHIAASAPTILAHRVQVPGQKLGTCDSKCQHITRPESGRRRYQIPFQLEAEARVLCLQTGLKVQFTYYNGVELVVELED